MPSNAPTTIGGIVLDYIRSESAPLRIVKTREPVETGAAITDHSYVDLQTVEIDGAFSDAGKGAGTSAGNVQGLKNMARMRTPITIVMGEGTFSNMILTEVSATRSTETSAYAFDIAVSAEEALFFDDGGGGGGDGGTNDTGSQSPSADASAPSASDATAN